jgi:hypothetical protein
MPKMNGLDAIKKILALYPDSNIIINSIKEDSDTIVLPKCELLIPHKTEKLLVCQQSPFLNYRFRFKVDCFAESKNSVVTYRDLCNILVSYLVKKGLILGDGVIKCDTVLEQIIKEESVNFFTLAKHFRDIIR